MAGTSKQNLAQQMENFRRAIEGPLADPDLVTAMARYSYDQAKLEAEQALWQAAAQAKTAQDVERGEAQDATKARDTKLDELTDRMSDLLAIAPIALQDNPQWLEKMGIVEPS